DRTTAGQRAPPRFRLRPTRCAGTAPGALNERTDHHAQTPCLLVDEVRLPLRPRYRGTDCPATYCASCPALTPALRPGKPREFANMTSAASRTIPTAAHGT